LREKNKKSFEHYLDEVGFYHLAHATDQWQTCEKGNETTGSIKGKLSILLASHSRWCNDYRACHWTQGSLVHTKSRAMDFYAL
jgi:hypothetical protein